MKNKLSNITLILTIAPLILIVLFLGFYNKKDYKLVDIDGNRQELGDISLISHKREGIYNTIEVEFTKDGVNSKKNVKEVPVGIPATKYSKENRDILNNQVENNKQVYKDDKSIGTVSVGMDYTNGSYKSRLIAKIKDKNLKTNRVKTYEIPIETNLDSRINYSYTDISTKHNGDVYLILGSNTEGNYRNDRPTSRKSCIKVYKLNLENESSQIISNKVINEGSDASGINTYISLLNKDIAYMIKNNYDNTSEDGKVVKSELIKYHIKEDYFETVEMPFDSANPDFADYKYDIEGDEVSFISYLYDKDSKELNIDVLGMNLVDNKASNKDHYTIEMKDKNFDYRLYDEILVNNKRYMIIRATKETVEGSYYNTEEKNYIYVLDEKNNKVLYSGEIKGGDIVNLNLVKKEDL